VTLPARRADRLPRIFGQPGSIPRVAPASEGISGTWLPPQVAVNPKAIQEFVGHATIEETFSRYGHLMPGARDQARELVDA